jgi:tetratricopeptide (TPR) repeat protein
VVLRHFSKLTAVVAMVAVALPNMWAQAAQEKKVKDQAEYDLFTAATKETDPKKKVDLLTTWKQKYPESDFKEDRQVLFIQTYHQMGNGEAMLKEARELLTLNPKSTPALYWITLLTVSLNNTTPERLDLGEKAARGLLANLEVEMAPEKKPQTTSEADWQKQRNAFTSLCYKTLGWIEMNRKSWEKAEQEFTNFLKLNPNSGLVSYWLGTVMAAQKKPEKQVPALFHFARAGHYSGDDALPADAKKKVAEFFERNYSNYTGSKEGVQDIIALAMKTPFPPPDFKLESQFEKMAREEEKMKAEQPMLYAWLQIKKALNEQGQAFFETMKGAALPKLKGKVVNQTPARRPKEITIGLSSGDQEEMKLVLDTPMANPADPGTEIEFDAAVPQTYTADPFLITADVEKEKITGWPAPAPTTKKGGGRKTGGKKK